MFFSFVLLCFVSYFIFIGFLGYHFVLHIFLFLSLRITIYIPKLSHSAYMDLMLHNVENLMMPYRAFYCPSCMVNVLVII